ncbi:MAG: hypothetical protein EP330_30485 [Deltaproteobacteria bacterium]|nr:MAG: hypothetical protein EP330_30485 [Deltaproteobacteria bacterium]
MITAADCTETCSDWCEVHPVTGSTCLTECHPDRQTNVGLCCPVGTKAVGDTCPLPDLSVDGADLRNSLSISTMRESDREYRCALEEGCLNGTGDRRLIRFDTTTPNTGVGDMHVGDPNQATDLFDTQTCHGHDHFDSYAWYEISGNNLNGVTTGRKQAFCLMDFTNWGSNSPGRYDCGNQGIQAGWADTYYSGLPCQYIDITDVPSGEYTLSVHVNYESVIAESDYSNNITEVTVNIP